VGASEGRTWIAASERTAKHPGLFQTRRCSNNEDFAPRSIQTKVIARRRRIEEIRENQSDLRREMLATGRWLSISAAANGRAGHRRDP
jgi:hypothetical protein